ncbi:MAG: hypothetical protein GY754_19445 [bacterium]|nr:hypothetical protein [bacterium]
MRKTHHPGEIIYKQGLFPEDVIRVLLCCPMGLKPRAKIDSFSKTLAPLPESP